MIRLIILGWYVGTGAVTFVLFWIDKRRAQRGRWRVPEQTLHAAELLGGWIGAFAAMRVLRHKNRKARYIATTVVIAAAHAALWAGYVALRSGRS